MNIAEAHKAIYAGKTVQDKYGTKYFLKDGEVYCQDERLEEIVAYSPMFNAEFEIVESERDTELRHLRAIKNMLIRWWRPSRSELYLNELKWVVEKIIELESK